MPSESHGWKRRTYCCAQVVIALAEIIDLKARLAKNSHNSGKPLSSDGLKRQLPRTRRQRPASPDAS